MMLTQNAVITLRAATAADQGLISRMIRDAHLNPFGLAWPNFLIAERDESIVGIGQLRPHRDGTVELASLVVVEEARNSGVGSLLVNTLIGKADRPLFLMCESGKVAYYQRFGFVELTVPKTMPRTMRFLYLVAKFYERACAFFGQEPSRIAIMAYPQRADG